MPQPIDDSRLIEMPGHLIRRLHQISFALFLDQAKAFDFTPVQYAALVAIKAIRASTRPPLQVIAFDRSTIGEVVGRLRKARSSSTASAARRPAHQIAAHHTGGPAAYPAKSSPRLQATQRLILAPLKARERNAFMQMLKHLVHLNNEHSRAPLRPRGAGRIPHRRHRA